MTLQVAVIGDTVSITDTVVIPSGQNVGQGTTTFQTDGREHSHDELMPGLIVVARWRGPDVLETILTGKMDRSTGSPTKCLRTDGRSPPPRPATLGSK